jgi:HSP90 family molecular chaperone
MSARNARHARLFTWDGAINLKNAKYITDESPIDPKCDCPVCRRYSRAYIRHLFAAEEMLAAMKESIGSVSAVKFSANLTKHPVALSSEGELSVEMEKVLKRMPGAEGAPEAKVVLEINHSHPITEKLLNLFATDRDTLAKYSKMLYSEACLIGGVSIEDPSELSELITELMTK